MIGKSGTCACGCGERWRVVDESAWPDTWIVEFSMGCDESRFSDSRPTRWIEGQLRPKLFDGVSGPAMRWMAAWLRWVKIAANRVEFYATNTGSTLGCGSDAVILGPDADEIGSGIALIQQVRANLIRTKLAAIEAKRARPLGWDPEGQA